MDDSKLNRCITILSIILILSISLNGYLYYNLNHVEAQKTYQSNYEANLIAYEVPLYNSAHYAPRNDTAPYEAWKSVNYTFNSDLNISFRFQYDSELLYVLIEAPFVHAKRNYTLSFFFHSSKISVATIFDASPPGCDACGIGISYPYPFINRSVRKWDNGWGDKEQYIMEIKAGYNDNFLVPPMSYKASAGEVSLFDIAIPINLIGSPQNGSSVGFAFGLHDIDHNELYQWGNPDDFSTYTTLMFR